MPQRKALLRQKAILDALIWANMKEEAFFRAKEDSDWAILDNYYRTGRALAAEHMMVLKQLERR